MWIFRTPSSKDAPTQSTNSWNPSSAACAAFRTRARSPPALPTTSRCPTLLDLPDAPGRPDVRVPDLPLGLFFSFIPSPSPPLLTKRSAFPTHPLLLLPSPPPLSGSGELLLPFFHVRELTNAHGAGDLRFITSLKSDMDEIHNMCCAVFFGYLFFRHIHENKVRLMK